VPGLGDSQIRVVSRVSSDQEIDRSGPAGVLWTLAGLLAFTLALGLAPAKAEPGAASAEVPLTWPNGVPRPAEKPNLGTFLSLGRKIDVSLSPPPGAAFADYYARLPPNTLRPGSSALTAPGRPLPLAVGSGNLTLAPTLNFGAATPASPYDPRISAPASQRLNPTPGLDASMDLGNVTLDTVLSRPLNRNVDNPVAATGQPAAIRPNMGVDLKLKF